MPSVPAENRAKPGRRFQAIEKNIEQVHICMALPGYKVEDKGQYPLFVLNNVLGGSMSSRLFQRIREERGLAYSIYTYPGAYRDTGYFALYAGSAAENAVTVAQLMLEEMRDIIKHGITQAEFNRGKQQLKGSYLLGQESTSGRMNAIGKGELLIRRIYEEREILDKIERITMEDINGIIPYVLSAENASMVAVGRLKDAGDKLHELLKNA